MKLFQPWCRLTGVGLIAALGLSAPLLIGAPKDEDKASVEIDRLIRDLGAASFEKREEATRRLMGREDAVPALRRALRSSDPEVARRVAQILKALGHHEDKRILGRLQSLAKAGELDLAFDLFARRLTGDNEVAGCSVMTELAGKLIDLSSRDSGKKPRIPPRHEGLPVGDYHKWAERAHPSVLRTSQLLEEKGRGGDTSVCVDRAEEISVLAHGATYDLLVSAGKARASFVFACVIFASGAVDVMEISDSIVVCDGDFTTKKGAFRSLIIARGKVTSEGSVTDCRIVTSAGFHLRERESIDRSKVQENVPTPLGFVRFFDPTLAGVTVAPSNGGVRVQAVAKNKPFTRAGLLVGDVVTALDDHRIDSPETFRRWLRAAWADGGEVYLKVRRGAEDVKIWVRCPE
jgi:hypothetical protein